MMLKPRMHREELELRGRQHGAHALSARCDGDHRGSVAVSEVFLTKYHCELVIYQCEHHHS
jgi:hypothetical protein